MHEGGYHKGYLTCNCFWGTEPAEYVRTALHLLGPGHGDRRRVIDLGCGEGKNAYAAAEVGFCVVGIDKSAAAIRNAVMNFGNNNVSWLVGDMLAIEGPQESFDLVVATGSLHCLLDQIEISRMINTMQQMTRISGLNVVYAFDDGHHDFSGHDASFRPTLLPHEQYLNYYRSWNIIAASSVVQGDYHPDTKIPHFHSITRILAMREG